MDYLDVPRDGGFADDLTSQGDIDFETDPRSLQRILENRELSPSVLKFRSSLTPAVKLHKSLKKNKDFEYFEGKNGAVFCRTKTLNFPPSAEKNDQRRFGRGILQGVQPVRASSAENSAEKLTRPKMATRKLASEKKIVSFPLLTHRQSISERKPIAGIDRVASRVPRPNGARKGLDFDDKPKATGPVRNLALRPPPPKEFVQAAQDESFEFPKPLPVEPEDGVKKSLVKSKKSIAELIMMRESLAGFPRESFSALFRQSLSGAELERMFEDDSTCNFEKLEQRLKTPKRPNMPPKPNTLDKISALAEEKEEFISAEVSRETLNEEVVKEEEAAESTSETTSAPTEASTTEQSPGKTEPEKSSSDPDKEIIEENSELKDLTNLQSHEFENYTEEDLANMEIIEYEFEDPNMSLKDLSIFDKSLSMADLREEHQEEDFEGEGCLPRSLSEANLECVSSEERVQDVWQAHLDELGRCRQEQADIERKLQSLMLESLNRKEQFRQVWGVSPKSINQKRNAKTLIGAHQISFTETDVEPTLTEINQIEDEIFNVSSSGTIFEENIESSGVDVEGISPTLSLDFSIPTDLFSQYIDANFPSVTGDNSKTMFHNVEDVFASQECDADHEPCNGDPKTVSSGGDTTEANAAFCDPLEKALADSDTESADSSSATGQEVSDDIFDTVDMEIETEEINTDGVEPTVVVDDRSKQADEAECIVESTGPDTIEPEPVEVQAAVAEVDFRSLVAAAKTFKKETKRRTKAVRFVTPQKSDVLSYDVTSEDGDDIKENVDQDNLPLVSINIPVNIGKTKGNISFNESGVFSRDGMVHTPVPKNPKFRMSQFDAANYEEEDENDQEMSHILPTPMALRDISNKAQQSLASLYNESPVEDQMEAHAHGLSQKILFEDDEEDLTS